MEVSVWVRPENTQVYIHIDNKSADKVYSQFESDDLPKDRSQIGKSFTYMI